MNMPTVLAAPRTGTPWLLSCVSGIALHGLVLAQCQKVWKPVGYPGTDSAIRGATVWDPDGPGPQTSRIVVVGAFTVAGEAAAANVAAWDPATGAWSSLGASLAVAPGVPALVEAVVALPNGDLVVGGRFYGGNLMRWDGAAWSPLGGGVALSSTAAPLVRSLVVAPNGDLVVGGYFSTAGSTPVHNVARWNGAQWSAMGAGIPSNGTGSGVYAMGVMANGDIVASGNAFQGAGSNPWFVERWNGSTWSAMGAAPDGNVNALATLPNGDLVAGGDFSLLGGVAASHLARWTGSSWSAFAGGTDNAVTSLCASASGRLVATGWFTNAGGVAANGVAVWDGVTWAALGSGAAGARVVVEAANGDFVVGADFAAGGSVAAKNVARWNGAAWSAMGAGIDGRIACLASFPNGDFVAGGEFTLAGGVFAHRIAQCRGGVWSALGAGLDGPPCVALIEPNGDVIVGGEFLHAGGVPASGVARWNGVAWSALGSGPAGPVYGAVRLANGDIVVGGRFARAGGVAVSNVARWDGTSWHDLGGGVGTAQTLEQVDAMVTLPNGDLVVGGTFATAGGLPATGVARWDGVSWQALSGGVGGTVSALHVLPTGVLAVGGFFATAGGLAASSAATWDGLGWASLGLSPGPNHVSSFANLPNGDLAASGLLQTSVGSCDVARLSAGQWWPLDWRPAANVTQMLVHPHGELLLGGYSGIAQSQQAVWPYLSSLTTPCSASAVLQGAGCAGSGGVNALAPVTLPWLGGVVAARASGLVANALAVEVLGLGAQAVPLPMGGPGCSLLVTADVLLAHPATATGELVVQHAVPIDNSLVGQTMHQQVIGLQTSAAGGLSGLTSTPAIALTFGAF